MPPHRLADQHGPAAPLFGRRDRSAIWLSDGPLGMATVALAASNDETTLCRAQVAQVAAVARAVHWP